ncbi:MAG: GntG family PLP-dependent aldolase [Planctomycetota bacterium]
MSSIDPQRRSDFRSDFRSDTVTRPTPAMRRAMADAEVGDDVLDGDPTVRALEARTAELLGKEGALFCPSGTMANQVGIGAWVRPGDEVIVEHTAHVLSYEGGALGFLHGVQTKTLTSDGGALDPDEVRAAVRPDFIHCPPTGLVCVEQSHMSSGGRVVPLANLEAVSTVARELSLPVHLDGARLFNAVAASGVAAERYAACADSVQVCLSKGLGAPVGSLVAGSNDFLLRARVVRKRLGGWMRQAGILAAAGLIALEEGRERLAEDHALAKALAQLANEREGLAAGLPETNLVLVRVERPGLDAPTLVGRLAENGVDVMALSPETLRFVTHRDVGPPDLERLGLALDAALAT